MAHKVQLAVYDISMGMAAQMSAAILGEQIEAIYHTGILVYGKEFFFGGGIQQCAHETFVASHGGIRPIQYLDLGTTNIPEHEFQKFLRDNNHRFTMQTYDLIRNNCNNFCDACAHFLLDKGIPEYIVKLPERVFSTPMGMMLKPMIENMQSSINSPMGGGTLDPFAQPIIPPAAPITPAPAPANPWANMGGAAPAPASAPTSTPAAAPAPAPAPVVPVGTETLDTFDKPWLNADKVYVSKSSFLPDLKKNIEEDQNFSLTEVECATLDATASPEAICSSDSPATQAGLDLLGRLLKEGPSTTHAKVLSLLKILVLQPSTLELDGLDGTLQFLAAKAAAGGDGGGGGGGGGAAMSPAARGVALAVFANLLAHPAGAAAVLRRRGAAVPLQLLADACLAGLTSAHQGLSTMASYLAFNLCLALPAPGAGAEDADAEAAEEVATQLLLVLLEGLSEEEQAARVARPNGWAGEAQRLAAAGALLRRGDPGAAALAGELGAAAALAAAAARAEAGAAAGGEAARRAGALAREVAGLVERAG